MKTGTAAVIDGNADSATVQLVAEPVPVLCAARECGLLGSTGFRELVSGRARGLGPTALRGGLRLAEVVYAAAIGWRNRRYDRGVAAVHRVSVPVVSVGNLTLGGTGKTPMVEWLVRWFAARGVQAAVISRGYAAVDGAPNDESLELAERLPGVMHLQNPDRVAAAQEAITRFHPGVIVLDDGFQHRRIARDLDIVLLDALEPFGFGHVFPRGMLREPITALRRTDVVVLTRADLVDENHREDIWQIVRRHAPQIVCAEATHAPQGLIAADGRQESLDAIRGQRVAAFCGIGNPAGFRHTLAACGCEVADFREFPDHCRYTPAESGRLAAWVQRLGVSAVLCTRKDLVKLSMDRLGDRPLWALGVELQFLAGQKAVEKRLASIASMPGSDT
jgi:tetraacyldisaccharide 4'-kinase